MSKIRNWLKGKKSYIVATVAILTALGGWVAEEITLIQLIGAIYVSLQAITIRAGIAKRN